jgi:hypothetical protein
MKLSVVTLLIKIYENRNDPKKLWKSFSTTKNKLNSIELNITGKMVYEKAEVANELNYFFTSKLVSKLPTSSGLYGTDHVKKYYAEFVTLYKDRRQAQEFLI